MAMETDVETVAIAKWQTPGMTPQTLGVYETDNLAKQACLNHKATKLDVHNIPWRKIHYPKYFMYVMEDTYINYYVEVWEVKHGNGD